MTLTIELEREDDGRFIADVLELPGVMAYGATEHAAVDAVKALALRILGERLEHGEATLAEASTIAFSEPHAA